MDDDAIVNRRVGGDDDCVALNCVTARRDHVRGFTAGNITSMSISEYLSAVAFDGLSQTSQVFQWMKLCLPREVEARPGIPKIYRYAINSLNLRETRAMSGSEFLVQ